MISLEGKTIVITGATAGIGHSALHALALKGARVIGVGRSARRCKDTRQAIKNVDPATHVSFVVGDLASQRQVRRIAADIREQVLQEGDEKIDVLINNAGTVSSWYKATEDGYELQFAVNHLAPFLLTHELLPLLGKAPDARVITVSSGSHYRTRMRWSDVMCRKGYNCLFAYKQSKLANVLFTVEFNRRLADSHSVRAFAVDPGLVNTDIGLKGTSGLENWVWKRRQRKGTSPEQGAATVVYLASVSSLGGVSGPYWKDCQPVPPSRYAARPEEAARLWSLSERLCGIAPERDI